MPKQENKALLPKLRFPEFREAGGWEEKSVGDFGEVVTGSTPSTVRREFYGGGIPFVSPADISDLRFVDETKTTLTALGFGETRPIKASSVLFVCIGSTIGKVTQNVRDCATNQQINSVIPNTEHSGGFVYYILSLNAGRIANLAGKQAVPIINKTQFSLVRLLVPKLGEQERIANCLASLDELFTLESQQLDTLKTHKKGLMKQLFPAEGETLSKLRFPEFREPWVETPLGNLCSSISSGRDQIDPDGAFDLYGSTSVIGKTKSPSFSGERILVARVGANAGLLTKAKGAFGVTDNTLVVSLNSSINMDFLFHYLGNININRLIFGSGQPLITGSILNPNPQTSDWRTSVRVIHGIFYADRLCSEAAKCQISPTRKI
jgi:type I restriction enzyme S subunit